MYLCKMEVRGVRGSSRRRVVVFSFASPTSKTNQEPSFCFWEQLFCTVTL